MLGFAVATPKSIEKKCLSGVETEKISLYWVETSKGAADTSGAIESGGLSEGGAGMSCEGDDGF